MARADTSYQTKTVLLMLTHEATRQRVEKHMAKAAFKVLPVPDKCMADDFQSLSDNGCVIIADPDGLSAANGVVKASGNGQTTALDLPIILLLTRKEDRQLDDEIRQRATYCLIKPVSENMLNVFAHTAAYEHSINAKLRQEVQKRTSAIGSIVSGEFEFQTLVEARNLATMLSLACPEPEKAIIGMVELMVNAIEHGNLGIGFEKKTELLARGEWQTEITRRLKLAANRTKKVTISFQKSTDKIQIRVTDEGMGFDRNVTSAEMSNPLRTHGRGIELIETDCFDSLEYQGGGTVAVAVIRTN